MFKRNITKIFIAFCMVFFVAGCASKQIAEEDLVKNNVPDDSYSVLVTIANHLGIELEDVSQVLVAANTASLTVEVYTAQQASDFVDDIRQYLKTAQSSGITYAALLIYAKEKYDVLPQKVKALIAVTKQFNIDDISVIDGADKLLSDYDYTLLLKALDAQDEIIDIFLSNALKKDFVLSLLEVMGADKLLSD